MMRGKKKMMRGGSVNSDFPDLNNDGKVTQADVLKGRGAKGFMRGGQVKMMRGGPVTGYKNGGCVMANRGVRNTKMV